MHSRGIEYGGQYFGAALKLHSKNAADLPCYLYPDSIDISMADSLQWVEQERKKILEGKEVLPEYRFEPKDYIVFWRLEKAHLCEIRREPAWFA
jgi:hypothetical protein